MPAPRALASSLFALVVCSACNGPSVVEQPADTLDTVVINEVMSRNQRAITDPFGAHDDWVELFNPTSQTVNLSGYGLSDDAYEAFSYSFPEGFELGPSAFTVVWLDGEPEQGDDHASFGLDGNGEALVFTTPEGERIDLVAIPGLGADQTYGRAPDGTANLTLLASPTLGLPNDAPGPILVSGSAASGVAVNELMASNVLTLPDEMGEYDDWVELVNTSDTAQSLSGHFLSDDEAVARKWRFPDDAQIGPGEFLIVWLDDDPEQGPLHADFKLSAAGESVVLAAPDGEILDRVSFGPLGEDESFGRLPDGDGIPAVLATPSPGQSNLPPP